MDDLEKLELIHCAIQEVIKLKLPSGLDEEMENALELIEDLREPHLTEQDDDDPNDYIDREHTKACKIDRVISHLMGC